MTTQKLRPLKREVIAIKWACPVCDEEYLKFENALQCSQQGVDNAVPLRLIFKINKSKEDKDTPFSSLLISYDYAIVREQGVVFPCYKIEEAYHTCLASDVRAKDPTEMQFKYFDFSQHPRSFYSYGFNISDGFSGGTYISLISSSIETTTLQFKTGFLETLAEEEFNKIVSIFDKTRKERPRDLAPFFSCLIENRNYFIIFCWRYFKFSSRTSLWQWF